MREMKNSGIGWVQNIPENWKVVKGKYVFKNEKQIVGVDVDKYERLALTMNGVVRRSKEDSEGLQPDKFNTYQILRKNELVFKLIDLQNISTSRVGLSSYTGIVSPAYIILKPTVKIYLAYAEKYYLMMWMNEVFNALGDSGVRSSLNSNELLNILLPLPPFEEQKQIADFLDKKCEEIDILIFKIQKEIELLQDYKKSIITKSVTKGLNKNVKLKNSGIEWAKQIPEHWEISKISNIYKLRNQKVSDIDFDPLSVTMKGIFPQWESVAKSDAHDDRKLVRKGDFVINSRSDRRGSCGISDRDGSVSLINHVLQPLANMDSNYYNWLFHTESFADEFYKWGHGIVNDLWTTNWKDMKRILIPQPPIQEQKEIAEYLDKKCKEIDSIIKDKNKQLDILAEYKKSIIYEYVTGKKEVI